MKIYKLYYEMTTEEIDALSREELHECIFNTWLRLKTIVYFMLDLYSTKGII